MSNDVGVLTSVGVDFEFVQAEPQARAAVEVLAAIWMRGSGDEPLKPELALAFAHSGNYVVLVRKAGEVVGAAIGFRGADEHGTYLHSHIAGIVPQCQGSSIGYALKQHQRSWAIEQGLERVVWTFDPLVGRNAYFNVVKLGASLTRYYVNFYGEMSDGINGGDESDRCLATWRLASDSAKAAAAGSFSPADLAQPRSAGAVEVLRRHADGSPELTSSDARVRLIQAPEDIVSLRQTDPGTSQAWRMAMREALTTAFADGLEVVGVSRDLWYVLARPPD
ncbi:MAG TPA: GNAT family N-acetyltransferase [Mycobacteriales bacterium]|nr:GNAT family N-acetyltransferase [Mycobacteriales bacterium]